MHRRRFLTTVGTAAGAGLALAACGRLSAASDVPSGAPGLVLRQPSYELLTGQGQRYAFLLVDDSNRPVQADSVEMYVADEDEEVVAGPFEASPLEEEADSPGTYRTFLDLPDPGYWFLIAVHEGEKGQAAVSVVDAADSAFPAPGDPAVPASTPTVDDEQGYEELCTAEPTCGMHEVSLESALDEGRPVLLQFATPAYCQTGVCGPSVQIADAVRRSRDWGEVAWVHVEIYTDAAETTAPAVLDWGLPSEPWVYAIGRDGVIVERYDGPLGTADVVDLADRLV